MSRDYRDPLYGFITVDEIEQRIIDSIYFQRLRSINQLGTTFFVYPSAMHSRFEHSLGTLFVVDKLFDAIFSKPGATEVFGWDKNTYQMNKKMLRLAALLHDLGHAPFSHAAEDLFPYKDGSDKRYLHEDYTYRFITGTEITTLISSALGQDVPQKVAEIASERALDKDIAFLSELLTGDFGADRIDYLIRDSYHLGVQYGRFDVHRLLNTLHVRLNEEKEGPEIAVESGGLHTIEAFLLARYFMFVDVYYHKTRRIFDQHLSDFLRLCLPEGCFPESLDEYLLWDDHRVMFMLQKSKHENKIAELLVFRKHYRVAFETGDHPEYHELERFDWLKDTLGARFGEKVKFDEAKKSPYRFKAPLISVKVNGAYKPIQRRSTVIPHLKEINRCRVYAPLENRHEVQKFCENFWEKREKERSGVSGG